MSLSAAFKRSIASRLSPELLDAAGLPFAGDWKPLSAPESTALLSKVSLQLAKDGDGSPWPLAIEHAALRAVKLPFYPGAIFVDAVVRDVFDAVGHAGLIVMPAGIVPLTTASIVIHELNARTPPDLSDAERALAYLRFFCWTVCGSEGPFQVVEDVAALPVGDLSAPDREIAEARLRPARVLDQEEADGAGKPPYRLEATILYSGMLAAATFELEASGAVAMIDDEPLLTGLGPAWRITPFIRYRETGDASSGEDRAER